MCFFYVMLSKVQTSGIGLSEYQQILPASLYEQIQDLASGLEGKKVVHVNATAEGGGVAEILKSMIPLQNDVGLEAEWYAISEAEERFFEITKNIHNGLQGEGRDLTKEEKEIYLEHNRRIADKLKKIGADFYVIHDPQPTACVRHTSLDRCICRIHIDTTSPRRQVRDFIFPFLKHYDRIIFSMEDFVAPELKSEKVKIAAPAINPFNKKNESVSKKKAEDVFKKAGIESKRPLVTQVSRFDPWKDPLGVIKAYKKAKEQIPELQLAYVGFIFAQDDPEALEIYEKTRQAAQDDPDIYLFSDPDFLEKTGLNNDEFVSAFQAASDVVLQKSIREGFGLTVTEAMWKGQAVIGGKAGGIKHQIEHGISGLLVESPEECAQKIVEICRDKRLKQGLGRGAKERVVKEFLLPRLLRDYLEVFNEA